MLRRRTREHAFHTKSLQNAAKPHVTHRDPCARPPTACLPPRRAPACARPHGFPHATKPTF
eukprot:6327785-Prymnesium_polylepis.1